MVFDPYARTVAEEMSEQVVSLRAEDSIVTALKVMDQERVSALPVVDDEGCCVGILSSTDLITAMRKIVEHLTQLPEVDESMRKVLLERLLGERVVQGSVADLMTDPAKAVSSDVLLIKAGRKMLRRRVHHLPVVDGGHRLQGFISTLDLLAAFVKAGTKSNV